MLNHSDWAVPGYKSRTENQETHFSPAEGRENISTLAGKMAFPTRGGFCAILNLPTDLLVGNNKFEVFQALTAGYTSPENGEFVAAKMPCNHELRQDIRHFIGNPEWDDPDMPWMDLHIQLTKHLLELEWKLNNNLKIFWQLEKSPSGRVHVHLLFIEGLSSRAIPWVIKRMRREACNWL